MASPTAPSYKLRRWLRASIYWDGVRSLAEFTTRRARRLLSRLGDLGALRPSKPKKRSYSPALERLGDRILPTLSVLSIGGSATAGQLWPATSSGGEIGTLSDPAGYHPPYAVSIDWGDGTAASAGWMSTTFTGGIYGQHTFAKAGTYSLTISATGDGDSGSSSSGMFFVSAPTTQSSSMLVNAFTSPLLTGLPTAGLSLLDNNGTVCGCTNPAMQVNFNGNSVAVKPIFQSIIGTSPGSSLPTAIDVTLTWNGTAQATVVFDATGAIAGDALVANTQVASPVTASGSYPWSVQVVVIGTSTATFTSSGTAHLAVSSASEGVRAGDGWTFAGVNRLIATSDGVIWKDGQGFGKFFAGTGGGTINYTSPNGDLGALVRSGGAYTYTSPGALWADNFDSNGLETSKVTADGQRTTFAYSGVELTGIATPDGRLLTMAYDGSGNLQTVQGPAGTATLSHDSHANLTGVQRPDSSLYTYTYDSAGRLTVDQTPASVTTYSYDTHGLVTSIDRGLGVTQTITPILSQGWGPHAAIQANVVGVSTDALGHSTTIALDAAGNAAQVQSANGSSQVGMYNANYQPTLAVTGNGQATAYSYNASGDRTTATTPSGATTTYQYDPTLHEVTSAEDPLGNFTTYTYTGTGDLATTKDPTGAVTTNTWSGGLLQSTTNPLGLTTSYVYDAHNQLIGTIAPSGLRTSYTYDTAGNQTSVEQPNGTFVTTVYNSMGNVVGTIQPDGSRTTMTYAAGQVQSSSDVRGNLTTFVYDSDGRQVATIDPLGNRATTVYDAAGRVSATVDQYGNHTTYAYDGAGHQVSVEDHYGHFTTTVFDAAGQTIATEDTYGQFTTFIYDSEGRQVATEDQFGNFATSVYNAAGQLTASVDRYGNRTSYAYDTAGRQVSVEDQYGHFNTTVYDSAGNTVAQIDPFGNHTTFIFDSYGRPVATEDQYSHFTTTVYDSYGRASATIDKLGNATTTLYDAYGRVQATADALGNRTTSIYDAYGAQVASQTSLGFTTTIYDSYGRVSATEDALGNFTTTIYDSHGNVSATVDALGNHTTSVYDSYGRQVATEDALLHFTTTVYDTYGRVSATEDPLTNFTTTIYDSLGRVAATEDARSNFTTTIFDSSGRVVATEDALSHLTTTIFDSLGRVSATQNALGNFTTTIYDTYGRVSATEDPLTNLTTTIYDSLGRVSATENGLSHFTTTIYDSYGRVVATEDALGHFTTNVFDSYGRQIATIDPLGNRTTMVLDSFGRQVNEIDALSNKTTFTYDSLNRVVQEITPTSGITTSTYHADGRLSTRTDALTREITYAYDAVGNNTAQTWLNAGGSVAANLTFTYDSDGRQLTAANATGAYTLTYDATGEVTNERGPFGANLTMAYDADGRRTVVQDNLAGVTTSVYDADGNMTQELFGGVGQTPLRIDFNYDADGQMLGEIRYSDLAGTTKVATTSIVYDAAGNITGQVDKTGGGTNIAAYTNIYDAANQITSEQLNGGARTTYSYDAAGEVTGDGINAPTYDAEGNRTNTGYTTTTGNELQSDGTWTYTYDAAGNETEKVNIASGVAWTYSYDDKNELVEAEKWSMNPYVYGTAYVEAKVDYKYDAWGNEAERDDYPTGTGSPVVTRYEVDGWNPALAGTTGNSRFNVLADLDGSNALQTRYVHGDKIDQLLARIDGSGNAYWTLTDRQGSVRDVIDNTGTVKDALNYDAFGNIISESNATYRGSYAWTGRQLDIETDLQYNRARWYNPATSRWMSQDPLGFDAGDSNLYRYANNRNIEYADASGLQVAVPTTQQISGNKYGNWQIKQINTDGNVTTNPTKGYASEADITFSPNPKNANSTEIAFVQVYKMVDAVGNPYTAEQSRAKRVTSNNWVLDRAQGYDYGWYGYRNDGLPLSTITPGKSPAPLTDASLWDRPSWDQGCSIWSFETYAVGKSGKDAGKVYGGISWGFQVSAKLNVISAPRKFLATQSGNFRVFPRICG